MSSNKILIFDIGSYSIKVSLLTSAGVESKIINLPSYFPVQAPFAPITFEIGGNVEVTQIIQDGTLLSELSFERFKYLFLEIDNEFNVSPPNPPQENQARSKVSATIQLKSAPKVIVPPKKTFKPVCRDSLLFAKVAASRSISAANDPSQTFQGKPINIENKAQQPANQDSGNNEIRVVFNYSPYISNDQLTLLASLAFEEISATHVQLQPFGYFSSFLVPNQTALIVDIGHNLAHVVSICQRVIITEAIKKSHLSGFAIEYFFSLISGETDFFKIRKIKEKEMSIALPDVNSFWELNPDLSEEEIYKLTSPEILFQPTLFQKLVDETNEDEFISTLIEAPSLPDIIISSIEKSPINFRKELYEHIYLTGGTSQIRNLHERLTNELNSKLPLSSPANVHLFEDPIFSSIRGALNFFDNFVGENWLSFQEFDNGQSNIIGEKFGLLETSRKSV